MGSRLLGWSRLSKRNKDSIKLLVIAAACIKLLWMIGMGGR